MVDTNNEALLRKKAYEGLESLGLINSQPHIQRLEKELGVVSRLGFTPYFLVMWDIARYARENKIIYGPGRGCFLPNTNVHLPSNQISPISEVDIGQEILTKNGDETVTRCLSYFIDEEIVDLELENGKIISCTKDHLFLTKNRGWIRAEDLDLDLDDLLEI